MEHIQWYYQHKLCWHEINALLMHEIMWDSADSWIRLQVHQNTYFALLTMVIALCTIKHLWIWTCWTNCTVFFMSILVDFFHFKFVLLDNFCSCCYYNYIASLTSYWTKLYRKLAACSLYHTGVMLEQKYSIKLICQYGYVSSCKVQTYKIH